MNQSSLSSDQTQSAMRPALIEHFSIDGLYGYRSVSLSSKYAATVLIARNGSGKTTLIAALDAFLRGQFTRLTGLQFEKITCRVKGASEDFVLHRSDIDELADFTIKSEIGVRAKAWDIQPLALMALIEGPFRTWTYHELTEDPTFSAIYTKMGYDYQVAKSQCERLAEALENQDFNVIRLRNKLRSLLGAYEIVYLPTYRRIELSLPGASNARRGERRKSVLARLGVARTGLHTADIQFGLSDIPDRLAAIYSEMLYLSNQGYAKVSANIISDLISGSYRDSINSNSVLPTRESIDIFFSRIKEASREFRRVPYNFFSAPNLEPVYSGHIPQDSAPFLRYFLNQLNSVILETKGYEDLVQAFIKSCNKYLSGDDGSTDEYTPPFENDFDRKELDFNRRDLEVTVKSKITGDDIPLEALSSGEKQMMSLFARLYLYPGPKLVLIDEPELSLSLDWQRQILPDVLRAPTCEQVIAITHSPFIFDNELEPFAGSLRFRVSKDRVPKSGQLFSDNNTVDGD